MSFITWNSEQFSVDVDEMDDQHKRWIALINTLHTSLVDDDSIISTEQAVKEMIDYTKFHFNHEESLMRDVQYPGYEKHKLEHDHFILKMKKLDHDIINGTYVLKTQIMGILKNWLEDHICKADMAYGAFISKSMKNQ